MRLLAFRLFRSAQFSPKPCYNFPRPPRVSPSDVRPARRGMNHPLRPDRGEDSRVRSRSLPHTGNCIMNDPETIKRFIFLRSQGWSFNRISQELNVSKPTLIKWSRQHQFDIQNLRATETEALAETVFGSRQDRWRKLAAHLKRIEDEIEKRDLEDVPAGQLLSLAARLRAEIQRDCNGSVHFSETTGNIPGAERVFAEHQWQP